MNFDWTTFFLELLNFFILLWILRRFLYRPVLEVIAARQRRIDEQMRDAERIRAEADATRAECEKQLQALEREKADAFAALETEIAGERGRLLARVEEDVAAARARRQAQEERDRLKWTRMTEQRALALGGRFLARLLDRVTGPELESGLAAAFLADLPKLPATDVEKLRAALAADGLEVTSAFPLTDEQRGALAAAIGQLAGREVEPRFREDRTLRAGLCIHAGPWLLGANLRDELKFFQDVAGQADD